MNTDDKNNVLNNSENLNNSSLPKIKTGNLIRVYYKIIEGKHERIQMFTGVVISKKRVGTSEMFTVRKFSFGYGVERTYYKHSPKISKIEILKTGIADKKRRSKLFYLRNKVGRAFNNAIK